MQHLQIITRQQRLWPQGVILLLVAALLSALNPGPRTLPAIDLRASSALLALAEQTPTRAAAVIVQKLPGAVGVEDAVRRLGGVITRDLAIINGFSATVAASAIPALAQAAGVKWISPDVLMEGQACPTCVDTSRAASPWLSAARIKEAWAADPQNQGQHVGVAVLDSGVITHPDLVYGPGNNRITVSVVATQSQTSFYRAINFGGPATTIAGNHWDGAGAADVALSYTRTANAPTVTLSPSADAEYDAMLRTAIRPATRSLRATLRNVPNGVYDVFLYVAQYDANGLAYNIELNYGVVSSYTAEANSAGRWERLGPFRVAITDDVLRLSAYNTVQGSNARLMIAGMEIWRVEDAMGGTVISSARDEYGHGTHVAGIIGGNGMGSAGTYVGVAPQARLINVRVLDRTGASYVSDVIAGMEWILENRTRYNIRVANISLNSSVAEPYHESALSAAAQILWINGIVVITSAGNNGEGGPIYPPANDPMVITVGAVDDQGTPDRADDQVAAFSARGITEDGFSKPEVLAPGVNIVSLNCHRCDLSTTYAGNIVDPFRDDDDDDDDGEGGAYVAYFRASGTSMSAPIVSGIVALMLQQDPTLTPDQVKARLINTGSPLGNARYVDAYAALTSTDLASANIGIDINRQLFVGDQALAPDQPKWDSARWGSARWGSARWGSMEMQTSMQGSVSTTMYFGPLAP